MTDYVGFDVPAIRGLADDLSTTADIALSLHQDLRNLLNDASGALGGSDPTGYRPLLDAMASGRPTSLPGVLAYSLPPTVSEIRRRCDILDSPGRSRYLSDVPLSAIQVFSDPPPDQSKVTTAIQTLQKLDNTGDFGWDGDHGDLMKFDQQLESLNSGELDLFFQQCSDADLQKYAGLLTNRDTSWYDWDEENGISDVDRRQLLSNLMSRMPPDVWDKFTKDFPGLQPNWTTTDVYVNGMQSQKGQSVSGIHWGVPANMPLFNGPVDYTDVTQGQFGDCWYLSSIIATAVKNPQFIQSGIVQNANGTVSVRLWDKDGNLQWVTVTPDLPLDSQGNPIGAHGNGDLWAAYYEKAFALTFGGDKAGARDGNDNPRPYDSHEHGDYGAIEWNYTRTAPPYVTGQNSSGIDNNLDAVKKAFNSGHPVIVATDHFPKGTQFPKEFNGGYVPDHLFYVQSVTADGKVVLGNPWGPNNPTLTIDENLFKNYFNSPQSLTVPSP